MGLVGTPISSRTTCKRGVTSHSKASRTAFFSKVAVSQIKYDPGANTVSLTVSGRLSGIFPLTISETASGPVECFRTTQSKGANCG